MASIETGPKEDDWLATLPVFVQLTVLPRELRDCHQVVDNFDAVVMRDMQASALGESTAVAIFPSFSRE